MTTTSEPWRDALARHTAARAEPVPEVSVAELVAYRRGRLDEDDAERVREALAANASLRALYAAVPADDPEPVVDDPEVEETVAWLRAQRAAEAELAAGQAAHPPVSARSVETAPATVVPIGPRLRGRGAAVAVAAALLVAATVFLVVGRAAAPPGVLQLALPELAAGQRGADVAMPSIALTDDQELVLELPVALEIANGTLDLCGPYPEVANRAECSNPLGTFAVTAATAEIPAGRLEPGIYLVEVAGTTMRFEVIAGDAAPGDTAGADEESALEP